MNKLYYIKETTVYGKKNLNNQSLLKTLYSQGVTRIKLNRGKYYDLYYSSNIGCYVVLSGVQYDIKTDKSYIIEVL